MPVESIGPIYETKIPGLADAADIQKAFYAYHYGAYTSVANTAGIITPSMAQILNDIKSSIATLDLDDLTDVVISSAASGQVIAYNGTNFVNAAPIGNISSITSGTGISITNPSGPVPTVAVDTSLVATTSNTMTLANKTLTAPKFASAGEIDDVNGNELIKFPATVASAVNEITITNSATGSSPIISASGDDTNLGLNIYPKGTGSVNVVPSDNTEYDGIKLLPRAGGTSSYSVTITPTTLTGNRTLTFPNVTGTIVTTGDTGSVTNAMLSTSSISINGSNVSLGGSVTISGESFSPFMLIGA